VTPLEELTGFPECSTPGSKPCKSRVHAGLLEDLRKPEHAAARSVPSVSGLLFYVWFLGQPVPRSSKNPLSPRKCGTSFV